MPLLFLKTKSTLKALGCLASHYGETPQKVTDISDETDLSISYLEQLFSSMREKNIVVGTRGPGGGYSLTRPADHIKLCEVLDDIHPDEESIFKLVKNMTLKEACS